MKWMRGSNKATMRPSPISTASSPLSPVSFGSPGAQATNSTVEPSVHENWS
jgi:hypothetical protein